MDPEKQRGAKTQKQPDRTRSEEKKDPRRIQDPGQVSHPDRKGEGGRQPEEPHGDSEAV